MSAVPHPTASRFGDPRYYQIAVLTGLLTYGTLVLEFDIRPWQIPLTLAVALLTQWACTRIWELPAFDPRSALISALSLCLLLRVDALWVAVAAAVAAVASKFIVQVNRKHIFNPTNGAIVLMMLATPAAWLSPGQWGNVAFFAFLMACFGGLVVNRAARSDVTWAFMASWLAVLFGRALWLGQPLTVPLHQLQNGAFLLFTFFMISDPKTTPDSRAGRILFAMLVAAGAGFVQFVLFRTNGLLWSLATLSMLVPLIDRLLPGSRYEWRTAGRPVATPVPHQPARPPVTAFARSMT